MLNSDCECVSKFSAQKTTPQARLSLRPGRSSRDAANPRIRPSYNYLRGSLRPVIWQERSADNIRKRLFLTRLTVAARQQFKQCSLYAEIPGPRVAEDATGCKGPPAPTPINGSRRGFSTLSALLNWLCTYTRFAWAWARASTNPHAKPLPDACGKDR